MLVLVVNAGSSSLKYQLIDMSNEQVLAKGIAERIGTDEAQLKHESTGKDKVTTKGAMPDHQAAMKFVAEALTDQDFGAIGDVSEITAIGHRVVHGGEHFSGSVAINDEVIKVISELSQLAPLHNPPNLMGIHAAVKLVPEAPQIAVFDTAFHQSIPSHAYIYALPYDLYSEHGIRRYGFHGTSHKYVAARARKILDARGLPSGCIVTCHIGNGVSFTAVKDGKSVDTSMGLTPVEGLVMGTRCGDIDPAIMPFLQKEFGYTAEDVDNLINKKSGLHGITGLGNDMRDIEAAAEAGNERALLALKIFCYRQRKYIGAFASAMGGLDAIVFTAGIGEHSPRIRAWTCEGLEFLGVKLNKEVNDECHTERDISTDDSKVRVLVIPTNEELAIARETARVVSGDAEQP